MNALRRLWQAIDHRLYVRRWGHAVQSDGRRTAWFRAMGKGLSWEQVHARPVVRAARAHRMPTDFQLPRGGRRLR